MYLREYRVLESVSTAASLMTALLRYLQSITALPFVMQKNSIENREDLNVLCWRIRKSHSP